jgi:elongation factor Tu
MSAVTQDKFSRDRPSLSLLVLGGAGAGKDSLVTALRQATARSAAPTTRRPLPAECETARRYYSLSEGSVARLLQAARGAAPGYDGALLVVSADAALPPEARAQARLARQLGLPTPVVFVNKLDLAEGEEALDRLEREVRELLSDCGFSGDEAAVVRGSAAPPEADPRRDAALSRLLEALD